MCTKWWKPLVEFLSVKDVLVAHARSITASGQEGKNKPNWLLILWTVSWSHTHIYIAKAKVYMYSIAIIGTINYPPISAATFSKGSEYIADDDHVHCWPRILRHHTSNTAWLYINLHGSLSIAGSISSCIGLIFTCGFPLGTELLITIL